MTHFLVEYDIKKCHNEGKYSICHNFIKCAIKNIDHPTVHSRCSHVSRSEESPGHDPPQHLSVANIPAYKLHDYLYC